MSEEEKTCGGSAISSSTITVEKSNDSPHKQLFRPNEWQEDPETHNKRLKSPFVPSVEEKLKKLIEDSDLPENAKIKERMEYEHSVIVDSDKHKQSAAKKMSSSIERRELSHEAIILAPVELDSKKGATITPPQPIPTKVSCKSEIKEANQKSEPQSEEDSIHEEIAELQTPDMANKHSEWHNISLTSKKKETSWNDKKYHENIAPKETPHKIMLDRRASITPCFRQMGPNEGPSGISINLPKKSLKCVNQLSGINITISKKCIVSKSNITTVDHPDEETDESSVKISEKIRRDAAFSNFVDNLKEKFCNIQTKMKSIFHT